ncbi:carboxypeptidase-like regulatory domain-containing protein [Hyalangium minutum]|uniref:Carboxypeptidase regulatory-like domain-containing protein n=1 Tax=Hyalangium minutum TaxID=394096 RepID=A0A085W8A9_9BACT|nr:carboxypeptidase-like regulatory domain-containing protein [Hyalangium minutum]KFE63922.1 hypothetical protein DB31_2334 [Hyalangium minutum]
MPKTLRLILAVLLLALPALWWGLRTPPEAPAAPGPAQAAARPGSSPASRSPHTSGTSEAKEPEDDDLPSEDIDAELLEEELAGPGPCIELEVTALGAPVPNAKVGAVRLESEDLAYDLTPLPVGPEGRRQAWCKPGEYSLAALAPGFAVSRVKLTVKEGGAKPIARFELTSGHTLTGRVLDKDSEQPLAGAQLSLQLIGDDFSGIVPDVSVTSDARGLFRVDTLVAGTYLIEAKAPGHTETSLEVEVPGRQSVSIELEGTAQLEGQVVDGTGAPVPGAQVWATTSGRYSEGLAEPADAQGRFSLEVSEGTYLLAASATGLSGFHEGKVTVARGGLVDGLVIRLRLTGTLSGRAFVKSTQEPIQGAFLSLRHGESGWTHSVQLHQNGTFRAERLPPGLYFVSLSKEGFSDTRREDVRIESGQETPLELSLIREARLEGTVTDALGRPAEDASVLVVLEAGPEGRRRVHNGTPDESGHYQISGLSPGHYSVEAKIAWTGQPVTRELTLQEGETARADFVLLESLGIVEGTVRRASGGHPAYPVSIGAVSSEISDQTAEVDEQGHFTLKLQPGDYTFRASYTDAEDEGPERSVRVEAGKVARVSLTVPDMVAETSGIVLNARGEPVPEAEVGLDDGAELTSYTDTNGQGQFTLTTSLSSLGKRVSVSAERGAEQGSLKNVRVGSRNVVVRLEKAAALRGRIVTVRGAPVQGFELHVFQLKEDTSTDRLGDRPFVGDTFEWVDLPPGTLELQARTTDGRTGKVKVQLAAGQTSTAEVPVGILASVTGRLVNAAGAALMLQVSLDVGTPGEQRIYPAQDGRFEFLALEPGQHRMVIGTRQHILLELAEGEALDLGKLTPGTAPTPR